MQQPYVTELDLRHSLIPDELIDDLVRSMPAHRGPDLREDRARDKYDYVSFMERLIDGDRPAALEGHASGPSDPADEADLRTGQAQRGAQSKAPSSTAGSLTSAEKSPPLGRGEASSEGSSYEDDEEDEDVERHQGGAKLVASPMRSPVRSPLRTPTGILSAT